MTARALMLGCVLFVAGTTAFAQSEAKLGVDLDLTYSSKYMWRGFDSFGDQDAFMPSVNLDFFGTGLSANVWSAWSLASGNEDVDEIDYTLAFNKSLGEEVLGEDAPVGVDFTINYIYYDFPNTTSDIADFQEVGIGLGFPIAICPQSTLTPSYYFAYVWPYGSGSNYKTKQPTGYYYETPTVQEVDGWWHILGLSYDYTIPHTGDIEVGLNASGELYYQDGALGLDPGWTHFTLGAGPSMTYGPVTLGASVNYQHVMGDFHSRTSDGVPGLGDLNIENNEAWSTFNVTYSF